MSSCQRGLTYMSLPETLSLITATISAGGLEQPIVTAAIAAAPASPQARSVCLASCEFILVSLEENVAAGLRQRRPTPGPANI